MSNNDPPNQKNNTGPQSSQMTADDLLYDREGVTPESPMKISKRRTEFTDQPKSAFEEEEN